MKRSIPKLIFSGVGLLAVVLLAKQGLLSPSKIIRGFYNLFVFFQGLFPPDMESFSLLLRGMLETLEIAFVGTILGFLISLPLAFLATRTLFNASVSMIVRSIVGVVRTIPSILLGVIFVVAFGLGPAAGTLAVAVYTVGYLAKIFYEAFEGVNVEIMEATRSTGANRAQIFFFAVLPESYNILLSQLLFMFEYNIRASAIMGFVGAGGIGYYMMGYVQMLQYQKLMTAMLLTFVVVVVMDRISFALRSRVANITI